jgi:hypothetical protein
MQLARRISLARRVLLLTSAATAHAECAWVLWTERGTGSWPEGIGLCECSLAHVEPGLSMLKSS